MGQQLHPDVTVPAPGLVFGAYPEKPDQEIHLTSLRFRLAQLRGWHSRRSGRTRRFVAMVRALECEFGLESPEQWQERVCTVRALLARDGFTDPLLAQAFALIVLACRSTMGITPHDTQLIAAHIMLNRQLAEMATGEGKTLSAGIAATAAAMAGVPVHVITANDYLVARDAERLRPLAIALGLSVGAVTRTMDHTQRQAAYQCDIAYCTARELVFDYLRDGLASRRSGTTTWTNTPARLLRGLCMAIIDEADAILIDEARVPLVLSRAIAPSATNTETTSDFAQAWEIARQLQPHTHFNLDAPSRSARLIAAGRARMQVLAKQTPSAWLAERHCEYLVGQALVARHLLQSGREYHVRDGKVLIVDETTGRTAEGRSWSGGLQQMVELKEGCALTPPAETWSQITYQRFFPRYLWLCGMSGTLVEARRELFAVYGLDVLQVPLHRPCLRIMHKPRVFADTETQWIEAASRIRELHAAGRPVLVGTDSVADSEALSLRLGEAGLPHTVLNARQDRHEAHIIASAGEAGAITVATNMAGRGTDIALGQGVAAKGGLHVISCQQNASPRMDRQLIGRCARHGDPGSAEKFIALDGRLLAGSLTVRLLRGLNNDKWVASIGALLLNVAQRREEYRQGAERNRLLRNDKEMSRWFAFGGIKE
ncbi:MAG: preprotein translocase subunit SecA [Burkholderiales bacterium]